MDLLLGTHNQGKVSEMSEQLAHLPYTIWTPDTVSVSINAPEETGTTFRDNAISKAQHYRHASGLPTIADDSGIIVEALQGELGVYTRRWGAGPNAGDEEWIDFFLKRMRRERNKRARFVCTIAHLDEEGHMHVFEGTCDGVITDELESDYLPGLPISACFRPDGYDLVYSAMPVREKNTISHRGRALQQLSTHLTNRLR